MLPVVLIGGRAYFRDDRLCEFRAVENLDDRILFKDYEWAMALKRILDGLPGVENNENE